MTVLWLDETDSTNAEARRRAEAGETGPLWIAARRQTAGHGRRGRTWFTKEGALAATLLTTSTRSVTDSAGISFVAALAVHEMIARYAPESLVGLKWPNDVLLDGHKVSGILVEAGAMREGIWLAVGIGVNLAAAPVHVDRPATSIAQHLRPEYRQPPTPDEALKVLAEAFERWSGIWDKEGLAPILKAWTHRSVGIPGPCTVRLTEDTLLGTAEGLDSEGRLRLRFPDGSLRLIAAGDVFFGTR